MFTAGDNVRTLSLEAAKTGTVAREFVGTAQRRGCALLPCVPDVGRYPAAADEGGRCLLCSALVRCVPSPETGGVPAGWDRARARFRQTPRLWKELPTCRVG